MKTTICPAKINLALHVGAVMADGYHPVDTLCVFVDAGDRLHATPADDFSLEVVGPCAADLADTPPDKNFILLGARLVAAETGAAPHRFILHKGVPTASGIGGGTANGVAAMDLLNQAAPTPLSAERMMELSLRLGADGPICMARRLRDEVCLRARGIGERTSAGPALPASFLCLANPRVAVSTGAVFRAFDAEPAPAPFGIENAGVLTTLEDTAGYCERLRNDLRPAAIALEPRIEALERAMAALPGCAFARMSGSGATVFGVFAAQEAAREAEQSLSEAGHWAMSAPVLQSTPSWESETI